MTPKAAKESHDRSLWFLKLLGPSQGTASTIPLTVEVQVTSHDKKTKGPLVWSL